MSEWELHLIRSHTRLCHSFISLVVVFFLLQEGPFVYMSLVGTVATSDNILAELCKCATVHGMHVLHLLNVCESNIRTLRILS